LERGFRFLKRLRRRLSAILRRWDDFAIIFLLLLMNGVVGFWQEHKSDNAIELLKEKLGTYG
jgi:H+-transporting ATPase